MKSLDPSLRTRAIRRACMLAGALTLTLSLTAPVAAQVTVPGFTASAGADLPAPAKGWAGLDMLPSGDLVSFDGQSLVTIDAKTGAFKSKLVSLPTAVFGSDVRVGPSGKTVYFCESSNGNIYRYDLEAKTLSTLVTLSGNFALAFHPLEGERFLYVSAQPGFTGPSKVFRIDTQTTASDLICEAEGYAGPLMFDRRGGLYFSPSPLQFGKKGLAKVLRFPESAVVSAIGPGHLKESQGLRYASTLDNVFGFAFDSEGTMYATDTTFGSPSVQEIRPFGAAAKGVLTDLTPTFLVFAGGEEPFERFGRPDSKLYIMSTDFAKKTRILTMTPARPVSAQVTGNPIPKGSKVEIRTKGCPANAFGIHLLGTGFVPEQRVLPLGNGGLQFPAFGIVLTAPFIVLPAKTDSNGEITLSFVTPKSAALDWTTQVLAGPVAPLAGGASTSQWVTSNPVRSVTQ